MKTLVGIILCVLGFGLTVVGVLFGVAWLWRLALVVGVIGGWALAAGVNDV